jgi:hypothetical protein
MPTNTRQFIQIAGRIWHKSYRYGTNRLKGILNSVEATQVSICTLCNRVEDPSHIYSRCKNPLLRRLREATFDTQTRALQRLRTDPECPKWESSFFRKFHNRSFSHRHDRAETCWNGTLNPADLQSMLRLRTPPRYQSPLPSSKISARDSSNSSPHFLRLQSRWKLFNSNPV